MINLKNLSFKKKIAALTLAAVSVIVPVASLFSISKNANAETVGNLSIGDKVAFVERATELKNSTCVRRLQLYYFTLYYEGTFDNVFVEAVQEPKFITSPCKYNLTIEHMNMSTYNLTNVLHSKVTADIDMQSDIDFTGFLDHANGYIKTDYDYKEEWAKTVTQTISYTKSTLVREDYELNIKGDANTPLNHYYGDMLMMARANKFKLKVEKIMIAKYRKSALHKWSEYQTEYAWPIQNYIFYSSYYNTNANFYRLMGDLGTHDDYIKLISNAGK